MSKSSKKKSRVAKITEEEYANYIATLKGEPATPATPDSPPVRAPIPTQSSGSEPQNYCTQTK